MTRRTLLGLTPSLLIAEETQPAGKLAETYSLLCDKWVTMWNTRVQKPEATGTVDYQELITWDKVKRAWKALEKAVDKAYEGR